MAADDLLRMLAPGKLTGISFFVEGQLILAHEKMLCARPEHFDAMLDRQTMATRKAGQGQGQGQPLPVGDTAAAAFRAKRLFGSLCTQWNEPLQARSCVLIDDATGARAWSVLRQPAVRQRCGAVRQRVAALAALVTVPPVRCVRGGPVGRIRSRQERSGAESPTVRVGTGPGCDSDAPSAWTSAHQRRPLCRRRHQAAEQLSSSAGFRHCSRGTLRVRRCR